MAKLRWLRLYLVAFEESAICRRHGESVRIREFKGGEGVETINETKNTGGGLQTKRGGISRLQWGRVVGVESTECADRPRVRKSWR